MTENYVSISLPGSFVKKIDEVVSDKEKGYSSRAEFIKEACRMRLRDLGVKI